MPEPDARSGQMEMGQRIEKVHRSGILIWRGNKCLDAA
jgi:hypothetical protein